ncbi:MAG: hypothetical protein V2I65_01840 [Paracoccaceae bacterium]|nr:hypothetical protein [Paracoccaceae bacterium]
MFRALIVAGVVAGATSTAQASSIGFSLEIAGSANGPSFSIVNTSDSSQILGGRVGIGDTAYNFDCVQDLVSPPGGTLTVSTPETGVCFPGGGQRPDEILFVTTGFDPGESISFETDVDPDSRDATVSDFDVLLNGGVVEVAFDGLAAPLVADLSDPTGPGRTWQVSTSAPPAIPLPGSLPLLAAAFGAAALLRRRPAA